MLCYYQAGIILHLNRPCVNYGTELFSDWPKRVLWGRILRRRHQGMRLRNRLGGERLYRVLVLGDKPQDSQGVLRRWRRTGYTARDALSWFLKFSRVSASAVWAGKRFHSGVVLLMKEWRSSVVELGYCLSLSECDAPVHESARWRLKSSWPTATSLCMILNIRVRRWSCVRLVSSSKPSSESMAVTLDRHE